MKPGASESTFLQEINSMPQCRSAGVDLVLLLDGSDSVGSIEFERMKDFASQIVNAANIGPNGAHVTLFVSAFSVKRHVSFGEPYSYNRRDLFEIITNLQYIGTNSPMDEA